MFSRYVAWLAVRARRSARRVAGHHELHDFGLDWPLRHFVQRLQHFQRLAGAQLGAVDLELLEAVRNRHLQRCLDGADVGVHRSAQMAHARVVGRREGVAEDQKLVFLVSRQANG